MNNKVQGSPVKAREYAFLLLKFRLRSEKEIYERLKKKKFTAEVIKETLLFLKDKGFINDRVFAKAWIESRLRRPLGLRRIKQELILKGIDKGTIDVALDALKDSYSEDIIVSGIAKEKLAKLKAIDLQKAKSRVCSYLLRRGFSPGAVYEAMDNL